MATHRGKLILTGVVLMLSVAVLSWLSGCALVDTERDEAAQAEAQPDIEPRAWQADDRAQAIRHVLTAGVALQKERPERALDYYLEAMALTRDSRVVERAVQLAVLLRDDVSTRLAAERWQELAPENSEASQLIGLLALQEGDRDKGVAYLAKFIDGWSGATGDAFVQIGRALRHGFEDDLVVEVLRRLAEEYPNTERAHLILAQAAEQAGRKEQARRAASRAVQLSLAKESDLLPRSATFKAGLLQRLGELKPALQVYNRALEIAPEDVDLLYGRGVLRAALGDVDGAEEDLRRVLEKAPGDAHAQNALGYTLADQGENLAEAQQLVSSALEKKPESATILDSKGWVLYRLGRLEEALEYLRKAWNKGKVAEIGAHLGEVLWELEKVEQARQVWREAAAEDAENRVLLETLGRYGVELEEI